MGAVFRPKDIPSGRKKIIENAVKDFSPDVKNDVVKLLKTWEKTRARGLEDKHIEILGQNKAQSLFSSIKPRKNEFSNDELEELQDMFRESLTFD
jgi:hypothetical protein